MDDITMTRRAAWVAGLDVKEVDGQLMLGRNPFRPLVDRGDAFQLAMAAGVSLDNRPASVGAVAGFGTGPAIRVPKKTPRDWEAACRAIVTSVSLLRDGC